MTAPMPAMIDSAELNRRLASGAPPRVLDVRTPGEFETVHMPGSYNVPLDLLREHRDEILAHVDEDGELKPKGFFRQGIVGVF